LAHASQGRTADQKIRQQCHRLSVNPALGKFSFLLHVDQSGSTEFFDMMGDRGLADVEIPSEVSNALFHLLLVTAGGTGGTARDEVEKDCEAVGIGKSLECVGVSFEVM